MAGKENMVAAFADYASQFLNRQQPKPSSSLSSSQPLFFSFTSDGGSRAGNAHSVDLDDLDDPHLRASEHMSRQTIRDAHLEDEDDDPYLRLDDEGAGASRQPPRTHSTFLGVSESSESKGWLAHASPLRSPSPPSSLSSIESRLPPPPRILSPPLTPPPPRAQQLLSQPLPPPRTEAALSLTESLLPRDGLTRPVDVFSLPDPRYVPRGRRKHNDSIWTVVWCTGITICYFCCLLILLLTRKPPNRSKTSLPYTTLLHTVPMLTILITLSAIVSYVHIFLLRIFVKPVMVATSVFIPATLLISAIWAFVGSFMWDEGQEPTWGETVGLRLFSLIPLALAVLTGRRLLSLPRELHIASSLLNLTTSILATNPFLLGLSPAVLLAILLVSIPFLTLAFRLLLIGYFSHPFGDPAGWEWHVRSWANWAIAGTVIVWLWTWGVARGLLRVTCAGVIGAWYFADPTLPLPPPASTHTIHAALFRATQPSFGTICLAALILAGVRLLGLLCLGLRALPVYLPPYMRFVSMGATMAVGYLERATSTLSTHALAYVGLTGDPFFPSARRARALTGSAEESDLARYRRKFKTEPPLTMLTVAPLTLTFPFALTTYLFVAHTLDAPNEALSAAMLAGGVTALVGLFSVGLVKDTADTLYICYCIDKEAGTRHRDEVFAAFEYETRRSTQPRNHTPRMTTAQPSPTQPRTPQPPHMKAAVLTPQPQPQFNLHEPRRTQRLEPPAREETPDPFDNSDTSPEDPFLPASSPDMRRSTNLQQSHPLVQDIPSVHLDEDAHEDEDENGEESQLFPGSDLF